MMEKGDDKVSQIIFEDSFRNFRWKLSAEEGTLKYSDAINYGRRITLNPDIHNCVMCGRLDVNIPSQNKDVCKSCDTHFWYNKQLNIVFKFCKGCKNFFPLDEFCDRPEASKCGKCRKRG